MKRLVKGLFFLVVVVLLVMVLTFTATMRNIKVVDVDINNGVVDLDVFGNVFDYRFIQ